MSPPTHARTAGGSWCQKVTTESGVCMTKRRTMSAIRDGFTGGTGNEQCPKCNEVLSSPDACSSCKWKAGDMVVKGSPVKRGLKRKPW